MPSPVTTTRRLDTFVLQGGIKKEIRGNKKIKLRRSNEPPGDVHLRLVTVDVINGSLNGGDLLSFFVRNLSIKLFFQSHYQLNGVKRICAQVFNEGSGVHNFFLLNAQLVRR
ncbi:Uncharacterised protein [Enterobacter asburiae]|uniref:Uncharacterized protein n=1 Tax=Enterobacter asburiae TaxID=61645 RepID=A0A376F7U6_ENTAS|nr:Uncharacterised protein [Enterobacter asburiae]